MAALFADGANDYEATIIKARLTETLTGVEEISFGGGSTELFIGSG
jgi:hypothetical protein